MVSKQQEAYYRPTAEALRLTANMAVNQALKSNFGVISSFYRLHECQHTLKQATERRYFNFDTAYGLLYLLGYRPQLLETADGFALLLLPSSSYNQSLTLEVAIQEAKVYLARTLSLPEESVSIVKQLRTFSSGMAVTRNEGVPREKFLLEFTRYENVA